MMNNLRISKTTVRWIYWGMFVYILATISIATLVISFHIHPAYSAPLLCVYTLIMFTTMVIHPFSRWFTNRKGLSHGNQ
jgi:hypothetical protein